MIFAKIALQQRANALSMASAAFMSLLDDVGMSQCPRPEYNNTDSPRPGMSGRYSQVWSDSACSSRDMGLPGKAGLVLSQNGSSLASWGMAPGTNSQRPMP